MSRERTAALAAAAGLDLPPERLEPVTEALDELLAHAEVLHELLAHAEVLHELPLEGVEPLLGRPEWD